MLIRYAPVTVKANGHSKAGEDKANAAGPEERTCDSWQIVFYEGSAENFPAQPAGKGQEARQGDCRWTRRAAGTRSSRKG